MSSRSRQVQRLPTSAVAAVVFRAVQVVLQAVNRGGTY